MRYDKTHRRGCCSIRCIRGEGSYRGVLGGPQYEEEVAAANRQRTVNFVHQSRGGGGNGKFKNGVVLRVFLEERKGDVPQILNFQGLRQAF